MAADLFVFFGILIIFPFWITVCGGKKKKKQKAPLGKSTETAKPLIVPDDKKTDKIKSKKSTKSKVDTLKTDPMEKKEEEKKEEEKKKEDEEKKEKEDEEKKEKEDEKGSEMKKDASKVDDKKDEEKEEEKKEEEKKEEEKKEQEKKEEEKKDEKKSDENANTGKPHISVDPTTPLSFKADQSSQSKLTVKNIHDKSIMFKIKLSDNVSFQVNPVFGVLEPGKTIDVAVTHRKSPPKEGKLVIVNTLLVGDEKKVAETFKTVKNPTGGQVTVKWAAK